MRDYAVDTESLTQEPTEIWSAGLISIEDENEMHIVLSSNDLLLKFEELSLLHNGIKCHHFNLAWDCSHIFYYALSNELIEITTILSDKFNKVYKIDIKFKKSNAKVIFVDVANKFDGGSLDELHSTYSADKSVSKGITPLYKKFPSKIPQSAIDYLISDIKMTRNLVIASKQFGPKLTASGDALHAYKLHCKENDIFAKITLSKKDNQFETVFPQLSSIEHTMLLPGYKGGLTMIADHDKHSDPLLLQNISVIDVNGMYGYMMSSQKFPYGESFTSLKSENPYTTDDTIFAVIIEIERAILKPFKVPFLQKSSGGRFHAASYTSFITQSTIYCLCEPDYEMLHECYTDLKYKILTTFRWKCSYKLFSSYIKEQTDLKAHYKQLLINDPENLEYKIKYWTTKVRVNRLYGKFGTSNIRPIQKILIDDTQKLAIIDHKIQDIIQTEIECGVYLPVAMFTTAYARRHLIQAANILGWGSNAFYMDTDSLHIKSSASLKNLDMHKSKSGAWDLEIDNAIAAKYIRPKCYVLQLQDGSLYKKISGVPEKCKDQITSINDFYPGKVITGKKVKKQVVGGLILIDTEFTI